MYYRTIGRLTVAMILIFTVHATTGEPGDGVQSQRVRQVEIPDDEYIGVPSDDQRTSSAYRYSTPDFFTTQVNVDDFGDNILGDAANEPTIAVDPANPYLMAIGWRQFDTIANNFRQAGFGYTTDAGQTWTFPGVIEPGVFRSDPVLDSDSEGVFYYNSLTHDGEEFVCDVFRSNDGGATWDLGTYAHGGDKQWMTIDKTGGLGNGNIYAYWTAYWSNCLPGFFTRSTDGGDSYEDCTTIPQEPIWGTLSVDPDGELYVVGVGYEDFIVAKSSNAGDPNQTVAWDFSTTVDLDGTVSFGGGPNPGGLLGQAWIATDHSGASSRGNVYTLCSVARNSAPDPLDIMFARSTDGGVTWSTPIRVNDDPGYNAYQWFGTMSVSPTGRIDAIWLDTRDDPGGYDSALYYAYSWNEGETWSPNQRLTPSFDPHVGWPQQNKMGDYFHMVSDETGAHLAWAATFNGEQDVYYGHISPGIHVPGNYATIQEAIDAATDGITIVVMPGTYHEQDIDFLGKAITVRSIDPSDSSVAAATIVRGDSLGSVFQFHSGEDSSSVLEGLTITDGYAAGGGGISCLGSSPTISRCHITQNVAYFLGGGGILCNEQSSPTIRDCRITENVAPAGGGIGCYNASSSLIFDNVIESNRAESGNGGGIHCSLSNPTLINNAILRNFAEIGGGIACSLSDPKVTNTVVAQNVAESFGAGISCHSSAPTIANSVIAENRLNPTSGGSGIYCSSSNPLVVNAIIWNESESSGNQIHVDDSSVFTISYSDVLDGQDSVFVGSGGVLNWGLGMIEADPLFRKVGIDDYHIMAVICDDSLDSPCIDAGDPEILDSLLDCSFGLGTTRSDMGAYGGGDSVEVRVTDEYSEPAMPASFLISLSYPNPLNPSTTILFELPGGHGEQRPVSLVVYDVRGSHVKTLMEEYLEPGSHKIHWDGRNKQGEPVSSGTYLYTLRAGNDTFTKRMTVLR